MGVWRVGLTLASGEEVDEVVIAPTWPAAMLIMMQHVERQGPVRIVDGHFVPISESRAAEAINPAGRESS